MHPLISESLNSEFFLQDKCTRMNLHAFKKSKAEKTSLINDKTLATTNPRGCFSMGHTSTSFIVNSPSCDSCLSQIWIQCLSRAVSVKTNKWSPGLFPTLCVKATPINTSGSYACGHEKTPVKAQVLKISAGSLAYTPNLFRNHDYGATTMCEFTNNNELI